MQHSEQIERFPSVPLVDLDLFLNDGVGACGSHLQSMTSCQMMESMDVSKAAIVTTGIPGSACPEGFEDPKTSGESPKSLLNGSPKSFLSALSSFESMPSSQRTAADLRSVRILGPDQFTIAGSVDSSSAGDSQLRRSLRSHGTDDKQLTGKRKVGRPIAYCGDPNSPDLTPAERRRIMRRIANHESARRVRARRLDLLDDMSKKAKEMEEANARLMERLASVESKHSAVLSEAQALDSDLRAKSAQNQALQAKVRQLRASLSLKAKDGDMAKALLRSSPDSDCSFTGVADLAHASGGTPFGYLSGVADMHCHSSPRRSWSHLSSPSASFSRLSSPTAALPELIRPHGVCLIGCGLFWYRPELAQPHLATTPHAPLWHRPQLAQPDLVSTPHALVLAWRQTLLGGPCT